MILISLYGEITLLTGMRVCAAYFSFPAPSRDHAKNSERDEFGGFGKASERNGG